MNTWKIGWAVGLAMGFCGAAWSAEEESEFSVEVSLPVRSAYVWRGQVVNDEAVFQPEVSAEMYGIGVGLWLNQNLTDNVGSAGEWDEVDGTLYYTRDLGPVNTTVGFTEYTYPHQSEEVWIVSPAGEWMRRRDVPSSREVFLELTAAESLEWVCVPLLSLNYDFGEADGFYGSLGAGYSADLFGEKAGLEADVTLGLGSEDYNEYYFGVDTLALNDLTVGVAVPIQLTEALVFKPRVEFAALLDDQIRAAGEDWYGDDQEWIFALALEGSF